MSFQKKIDLEEIEISFKYKINLALLTPYARTEIRPGRRNYFYWLQGIYILYNYYDKIVYVGQTANIYTRLLTHSKEKKLTWTYFTIIEEKTLSKRLLIEALLIHRLQPQLNIQGIDSLLTFK